MVLFICTIGDIYMKITKNYLKNLIKEELGHLQEVGEAKEEVYKFKIMNDGKPGGAFKISTSGGKDVFFSAVENRETLAKVLELLKTLKTVEQSDPYEGGKYKTTGD